MALIVVTNVMVLDNPAKFDNPFQFEITFECLPPGIPDELEWKLVYVGSSENETMDQELDAVLVGPISVGVNKFVFQAPAPDVSRIPVKDLMEVTVILLTCSYLDQEFIRIGYYVNNDYGDNVELMNNPPEIPSIPDLWRNVLASSPRVTRFAIKWTKEELALAKQQAALQAMQEAASPTLAAAAATPLSVPSGAMDDENDAAMEDYVDDLDEGDDEDDEEDEDDDQEVDLWPDENQPYQNTPQMLNDHQQAMFQQHKFQQVQQQMTM